MTRQEWQSMDAVIFMKNKATGFFLGFFNPSNDLLDIKNPEDLQQMVTNLNTQDNFIQYELVIGKNKTKSTNPGI